MTLKINYKEVVPVKRPIESVDILRLNLCDLRVWAVGCKVYVGDSGGFSQARVLTRDEALELTEALTIMIGELDGN